MTFLVFKSYYDVWCCRCCFGFLKARVSDGRLTLTCSAGDKFRTYPFANFSQERLDELCSLICLWGYLLSGCILNFLYLLILHISDVFFCCTYDIFRIFLVSRKFSCFFIHCSINDLQSLKNRGEETKFSEISIVVMTLDIINVRVHSTLMHNTFMKFQAVGNLILNDCCDSQIPIDEYLPLENRLPIWFMVNLTGLTVNSISPHLLLWQENWWTNP